MNIYMIVTKDHDLNNSLGKNFMVYQDIYDLEPFYDSIINDNKFPTIDKILEKNKEGFKIKYNINEMMFYSSNESNKLLKLYNFDEYLKKQYTKALILCNQQVYIED